MRDGLVLCARQRLGEGNALRQFVPGTRPGSVRGGPSVETERFTDLAAFQARVMTVEAQLEAGAFAQVGNPEILPHGWRGPFTN